jgi:uncharacterized protein YbjQ (UPF0145 family)
MPLTLLTINQYDETKYKAVGTVILNQVESISLIRGVFAGFGGMLGGKNTLIQEAVDRLQKRAMDEFTAKVQKTYPETVQVVALHTDVSEVGRDDNSTYMVMSIRGTCLVPLNKQAVQPMGGRRKTLKRRG